MPFHRSCTVLPRHSTKRIPLRKKSFSAKFARQPFPVGVAEIKKNKSSISAIKNQINARLTIDLRNGADSWSLTSKASISISLLIGNTGASLSAEPSRGDSAAAEILLVLTALLNNFLVALASWYVAIASQAWRRGDLVHRKNKY